MKKTLITGINGQDGSYLAEFLLSKGYEVHGTLKRNSVSENQTSRLENVYNNVVLHYADLTDLSSLVSVIQKVMPQGGDPNKLEIIPVFQEFPKEPFENMRNELGISNKFVYGFHQKNTEDLFSEVPLMAYSKIEDDDTCFIILGGSSKYREQAKLLNLKNFISLNHSGDENVIHSFLDSIDVFAHGRNDGETFGAVFTEAMYHKKPCVSHKAAANGHIEVIGPSGVVFERHDINGYANEMLKLKNDSGYYNDKALNGFNHYISNYSLETQIGRIVEILRRATNRI